MRLIEAANARLQSAASRRERRVARLLRQCEGPKIPNEDAARTDRAGPLAGWSHVRHVALPPCARAGARPNLQVWYLNPHASGHGVFWRHRVSVDGFGKRRRSSGLLYGLPAALGGPRRSRTISGLLGENHQHVPGTNNGLNNQSVGSVHV